MSYKRHVESDYTVHDFCEHCGWVWYLHNMETFICPDISYGGKDE